MFKIGDKVRRLYGPNYDGVVVGGIYTVSDIVGYRFIKLKEALATARFAAERFEYISSKRKPTGFGEFIQKIETK